MALGKKTGGRQRGTPNKRTLEIQELLARLNCDPIACMAQIAADERNPVELRARMLAELARYSYPRRTTVELEPTASNDPGVRSAENRPAPAAVIDSHSARPATASPVDGDAQRRARLAAIVDSSREALQRVPRASRTHWYDP